ncbi:MAG TPA: N-acetylmuramoyl-L-alanine amidase [Hyphomicrobiales bacterium]|nr:N-acetylmuramoyl-L-alanine amidase [Hyphomicrobiales bacterium]
MWRRGAALTIAILGLLAAPARAGQPPAAAPAAPSVIATAATVAGDGRASSLTVALSRPVAANVFALADPDRLVVDLPGVVFRAPPAAAGAHGLVRAYRFGQISRERARLVIDLDRPAIVTATRTVAAAGGTASLVVEFQPATPEQFRAAIAAQPRPALPAPPRAAAGSVGDTRPLIVLDPGHGGIDPGTHGPAGQEEKNIVLAFGKALRERLLETGRYRVLMTRDDDSYVALDDRVAFARQHQARLFVSIHADSLSWPYQSDAAVHGATIYTLSDRASDAEAARLAEEENRSDAIAGVDLSAEPDAVAGILIDLARRETHVFSLRFARDVAAAAAGALPLNKNPLRAAGFVVLKAPDVPSVLVELGYMSSPSDLKHLTSAEWRARAAAAMTRAINGFFAAPLVAAEGN